MPRTKRNRVGRKRRGRGKGKAREKVVQARVDDPIVEVKEESADPDAPPNLELITESNINPELPSRPFGMPRLCPQPRDDDDIRCLAHIETNEKSTPVLELMVKRRAPRVLATPSSNPSPAIGMVRTRGSCQSCAGGKLKRYKTLLGMRDQNEVSADNVNGEEPPANDETEAVAVPRPVFGPHPMNTETPATSTNDINNDTINIETQVVTPIIEAIPSTSFTARPRFWPPVPPPESVTSMDTHPGVGFKKNKKLVKRKQTDDVAFSSSSEASFKVGKFPAKKPKYKRFFPEGEDCINFRFYEDGDFIKRVPKGGQAKGSETEIDRIKRHRATMLPPAGNAQSSSESNFKKPAEPKKRRLAVDTTPFKVGKSFPVPNSKVTSRSAIPNTSGSKLGNPEPAVAVRPPKSKRTETERYPWPLPQHTTRWTPIVVAPPQPEMDKMLEQLGLRRIAHPAIQVIDLCSDEDEEAQKPETNPKADKEGNNDDAEAN